MSDRVNLKTKNSLRKILMSGGIAVVLLVSAGTYLYSGRYISTDNSYIKSAKILITPEVSGIIQSVNVTDNQLVKKGDVLMVIDPSSYQIAYNKAEADLGLAQASVEDLKAQYRQKQQDLERAKVIGDYNLKSYNRAASLAKSGAVALESLDKSNSTNLAAQKDVSMLQEDLNALVAQLGGNADVKTEEHPAYKAALSNLNNAKLNLDRTVIYAAVDGQAGSVPHPGDYAHAGVPIMNMVGTKYIWIEANYKETELTDVKTGQKVDIEVDTYPGHKWEGKVDSISPATGSEFSILPAQNATGNWVKVVQRIAVKIDITAQPNQPDLRAGMSTSITIDTGKFPHLPG